MDERAKQDKIDKDTGGALFVIGILVIMIGLGAWLGWLGLIIDGVVLVALGLIIATPSYQNRKHRT